MSTPAAFLDGETNLFQETLNAPDSRCKAFSDRADGAGWSEGVGLVVLKRRSDAERDGDRILAVIKGSAINQDGHSQGITAPNGPSQERVIQRALALAGLEPEDVDAIEAHGTGTALGDPIEAGALANVFSGSEESRGHKLWLGSSKSNIGHAQAAAGVLGVIKMVLAFEHELLPKTLHCEQPSPHIEWESSGLELLQEAQAWPRREGRVRRAGVSSFGISGTNAHLILEEAPRSRRETRTLALPDGLPLLISARTPEALREQARRWAHYLATEPEYDSVLRTAALHRTHFEYRAFCQGSGVDDARAALEALARDEGHTALRTGQARRQIGKTVLVFPGQGAQWQGMGRALLEESPVFAARIAECEAALSPYLDFSLQAVLRGDDGAPGLETIEVVQPALFAMSVALAALWQDLGIEPEAVVGHSQGEIAAAVVAGAITLDDGARVIALRSRLLASLVGQGGMLQVEMAPGSLESRLGEWPGLEVAVVNTPTSELRRRLLPQGGGGLRLSLGGDGPHPGRAAESAQGHQVQGSHHCDAEHRQWQAGG